MARNRGFCIVPFIRNNYAILSDFLKRMVRYELSSGLCEVSAIIHNDILKIVGSRKGSHVYYRGTAS